MPVEASSFWTTFMPHGHCYLWRPDILWLHVVSDTVIALAYFSIPIGIYLVLRKRQSTAFKPLLIMFSMFIVACGVSHLIGISTVWHGNYGIHGLSKAITAVISMATVIMLIPQLGKLTELKSSAELESLNIELRNEIQNQQDSTQALALAEQQFRTFLQHAPDGILIARADGEIEYSNNMANSMFGYAVGELTGRKVTDLVPERMLQQIGLEHEKLFGSEKVSSPSSATEFIGARKDGSEFPVAIRRSSITSNNLPVFAVTIRDISLRKSHEEDARKALMELAHISRLSTVGEMAAGLAHELNQPLTAISNNLHTAMLMQRKKAEPDEELMEIMQENYESAQRAGQIIRGLRQLVRKDDGSKRTASVNDLVATTVKLLTPEARAANVDIKQELELSLPTKTLLDTAQVQQVMVNLGRNAIEALAELKQSGRQTKPQRIITIRTAIQASNTILVSIMDNGPSLTQEVKDNLFQPYITSKESGMGLGLSICRTIVESQGGRLWHDDIAPHGNAFCFTISILTAGGVE